MNILDLKYLSYKEVIISLYYDDYLKLLKMKTIYDIEVIEKLGKLKIKKNIKSNIVLLIIILLGIVLLSSLSNMIFDIEIIHSKREVRQLIMDELNTYGISKYKFKKSSKELEKIEDKILENNKDSLEWIEIITSGTKYIVRVQERIINHEQEETKYQDIVAGKNATLTKIIAVRGEKVKELNTYVHKGDIIISGSLLHSDGTTTYVSALGRIYGDVWYIVEIEYPFIYNDIKLTGRKKDVYVLKFLNKKFEIFSNNKYKTYNHKDDLIFNDSLIPLCILKEKREETIVTESIYTEDEALNEALELAQKELLHSNEKVKLINNVQILDETITANSIKLKLFISVNEEITETKIIDTNIVEDGVAE